MKKIEQAQVRWTGTYQRTQDGALETTTSSFQTTLPCTGVEAFNTLASREGWLPQNRPHPDPVERAYGRPARGGWRLQHVEAAPVMVLVCGGCTQTCCNGRCSH
jgi:hypothetical protein